MVLLGLGLVIGLGYYAGYRFDVNPADTEPKSDGTEQPTAEEETPSVPPQTAEPKPPEQKPVAEGAAEIENQRQRIDRSGSASKKMPIVVYYADGLRNAEVMQPVEICVPNTQARIEATAEQVFQAPTDLKLFSSVPAGAKVNSVNLDSKTGVATVDASKELGQVKGSAATNNITASLVYSLTAIPGVKSVALTIDGEPARLDQKEWTSPVTKDAIDLRNLYRVEPVIFFEPNC